MAWLQDDSKKKMTELQRQYDLLDRQVRLAQFDEEQARLQERAKKRVYDYIRSNAGPYRKGNGGIQAYDTGDIIDGDGNVLKEGLRAKEFMQREVGDSQAKRAALELQLAEQARRKAWNEIAAMQREEDLNNRGIGSERDNFRKMYPPPPSYISRPLAPGERYNATTDVMETDPQGNMVIKRTAPNPEALSYKELEKNYLNNKRREKVAQEMGLSFNDMYGSPSTGNSGSGRTPKVSLPAGQKYAFNMAEKDIKDKISQLSPGDPAIDTYLEKLNDIENMRNNALQALQATASKNKSGSPAEMRMAEQMAASRNPSPGKVDFSFVGEGDQQKSSQSFNPNIRISNAGEQDGQTPQGPINIGENDFPEDSKRFYEEQIAKENARRAAEETEKKKKKKRVGTEFGPDEIELSLVDSLESGTATMPPVSAPASQ